MRRLLFIFAIFTLAAPTIADDPGALNAYSGIAAHGGAQIGYSPLNTGGSDNTLNITEMLESLGCANPNEFSSAILQHKDDLGLLAGQRRDPASSGTVGNCTRICTSVWDDERKMMVTTGCIDVCPPSPVTTDGLLFGSFEPDMQLPTPPPSPLSLSEVIVAIAAYDQHCKGTGASSPF